MLEQIFLDPVAVLELSALFITLCYVFKLTFSGIAPEKAPASLETEYRFRLNLVELFNVGTWITLPKESLKYQEAIR